MSIDLNDVQGGHASFQLGPITTQIATGQLTALIGPNGCGKSTLLNMIAGVLPQTGRIAIGGLDVAQTPRRTLAKHVTLLAQNPVVPPAISVEQLVHYGRAPHQNMFGMRSSADVQIVGDAMDAAGISDLKDRKLSQISGGQRQRVFIAMGIAQDTPYLLFDEPTSFLDIRFQYETLDLLAALTRRGKTCAVVLHDIAQAARYADSLIVMGEGRMLAKGTPRDVVTSGLIRDVYGLKVRVYDDPETGTPVMTPCVI